MLVDATVRAFAAHCAARDVDFDDRVQIRVGSTIPPEAGLGRPSAIVIATLRALATQADIEIERTQLARLALTVTTVERLAAADLQAPVAQTYEGLTFMDFAHERYESLDPQLLPELFVAWLPQAGAGAASADAHTVVRARRQQGDPAVKATAGLAQLAHHARAALLSGDQAAFGVILDAGFDLRASLFDIDPRHLALVQGARDLGLHATLAGEGGAIVGIASDPDALELLGEHARVVEVNPGQS